MKKIYFAYVLFTNGSSVTFHYDEVMRFENLHEFYSDGFSHTVINFDNVTYIIIEESMENLICKIPTS